MAAGVAELGPSRTNAKTHNSLAWLLNFGNFWQEPRICDREDDQRRQLPFDTCQSSYFAKMKYIHSKETLTIPDGGTFALAKETLCIFRERDTRDAEMSALD